MNAADYKRRKMLEARLNTALRICEHGFALGFAEGMLTNKQYERLVEACEKRANAAVDRWKEAGS